MFLDWAAVLFPQFFDMCDQRLSGAADGFFQLLHRTLPHIGDIIDNLPIQGAQLSKKKLEAVGARILGVVLNGYDARRIGRRDGYSYAYSYNYYAGDDQSEDKKATLS